MPCGATAASMAVGGVPGLLSLGSAGAEWAEGRHQGKAGAREGWTSERTGRPARACPTLSNHCLCQPHPCQLCTGQPHADRPRTKAAHLAALPVPSSARANPRPSQRCTSQPRAYLPRKKAAHLTALPVLSAALAKPCQCKALPVLALHKPTPCRPPSHNSRAPCGPVRAKRCPCKSRAKPCPCQRCTSQPRA